MEISVPYSFTHPPTGIIIGGSNGGQGRAPPGGPNSFIFMQFSAKNMQNNSTFGSWRTPQENPGSATDYYLNVYSGSINISSIC